MLLEKKEIRTIVMGIPSRSSFLSGKDGGGGGGRGEKMFGRMVTGVLRNLDNPTRNPMKNDGRREEEEEEKYRSFHSFFDVVENGIVMQP